MSIFGNKDPNSMVGARLSPDQSVGDSGFAAMGKPVPLYRQQAGYNECKLMGMTDPEQIWDCVRSMSNKLERDEPMDAMDAAHRFLDVTGVYHLMSVLLCANKPAELSEVDDGSWT